MVFRHAICESQVKAREYVRKCLYAREFTRAVPMASRVDAGKSLIEFTDDVGIPENLVTNGAGAITGKNTELVKEARRMRIKLFTTEQGRKNQNHAAEREIGFLAKRWKLRMMKKNVNETSH